MTIENIATMTPSEVDNILVASTLESDRAAQLIEAHTKNNEKREENLINFREHRDHELTSEVDRAYWVKRVAQIESDVEKASAEINELMPKYVSAEAKISQCNDEFNRRGGWTRYWIVVNSNGHIHSTMNCTTCFSTTQFAWLPNLSGSTDAEVVELAGMSACTICFPDAPVDTRNRPSKIEEPAKKAAREEREQKAAEKAAKVALKAIANPDGSVVKLSGKFGNKIKTEAEAQRVAVSNLESILLHESKRWVIQNPEYLAEMRADLETLITALAHKRGTEKDTQLEELTKKAKVKIKREWKITL